MIQVIGVRGFVTLPDFMPYRWRYEDRKGAWRPTQREALRMAMVAGVAIKCERTGVISCVPGAMVESGSGRRQPEPSKMRRARTGLEDTERG